jgi:predicted AlkP superfamily pyrophosphatase or phosphodiesterase
MPGREARVAAVLLRPTPHMQCWRKADIPARLAYGRNRRVPAFICLAEPGWWIQATPPNPDKPIKDGGAHGYDNDAPQMRALFIATGPAIRPLGTIATFDNVDIAPLLRDLIGLPVGQGLDGDDAPFRAALRR